MMELFARLFVSGAGRETGPPCCFEGIRAAGLVPAAALMGFGTQEAGPVAL